MFKIMTKFWHFTQTKEYIKGGNENDIKSKINFKYLSIYNDCEFNDGRDICKPNSYITNGW